MSPPLQKEQLDELSEALYDEFDVDIQASSTNNFSVGGVGNLFLKGCCL